jgi:hypothetical protein
MRLNPSITVELSQKYRQLSKLPCGHFVMIILLQYSPSPSLEVGRWTEVSCACVGVLRVVCYWCKCTLLLGAGVFGRFRL